PPRPGLAGGDARLRLLDVGGDRDYGGEAGRLEHVADLKRRLNDLDRAAGAADPPARTDQDRQRRRVDVCDLAHPEDQIACAPIDLFRDARLQLGRADDVGLARQLEVANPRTEVVNLDPE